MYGSPASVVPKPKMSTMLGWPIWLTARASVMKRSIMSGAATWRPSTLSAARLPMIVLTAP
jgi:hypothetical protein